MKSINKSDLKSLFKKLSIAFANTVAGRTITIDREDYGDIVGVDGPLLMEEWGSGYHRIVTACNAHNYPIPEWQEICSVIRVVFSPHPQTKDTRSLVPRENVPVNERQQWFLNQLKGGIQCKPVDISEKWNVVEKTAKRDIGDLQKKGLVVFLGSPKTGKYKLK